MSCNRSAPGDYELSEVLEAAGTDWRGVAEDDGGLIIDGPTISCNASRLEPGSDRVEVWLVDGETTDDCLAFIERLAEIHG